MDSWSVVPRPAIVGWQLLARRGSTGSLGDCAMKTTQERRQFWRGPFRARVTMSLPARQAVVMADVLDISFGGVHVICAEPVTEGEDAVLTFHIDIRRGVQTEEVSGRVIHARMDDDAWVVGLKFNQVLDRQSTPFLAQAAASGDTRP
jgi:PilZ domain